MSITDTGNGQRLHHNCRDREALTQILWRRLVAAVGGVFIGGALAASQFAVAPLAWGDRIVNVNDLCNDYKTGYVAAITIGTFGELKCVAPGSISVALADDSLTGRVTPGGLPGLPPGSYKVNPFDPFSDWVIPG
jgi:hypothetical protein